MLGPVLVQELQLGGRRRWQRLFRRLFTGWLALQLLGYYVVYAIEVHFRSQYDITGVPGLMGQFSSSLLDALVLQQLFVVLLATPAFAAGAITDEKARGTLEYLLTTDLSAADIILGKLLGRAALVGQLALAALPLLCLIVGLSGASLLLVVALAAVSVAPLFTLSAASLLASVWSRQTRDAVLAVYFLGGAAYVLLAGSDGLTPFDPLHALSPAWAGTDLATLATRLLVFTLAWGLPGVACTALAAWRLRPAYRRQLEGTGRPRRVRWWRVRRPTVAAEPLRWKERHVEGLAPLAVLRRVPRWLAMAGIGVLTLLSSLAILDSHLGPGQSLGRVLGHLAALRLPALWAAFTPGLGNAFLAQGIVALLLASLVVGIRCSGAVTGERERRTWEALLLTPLPEPQLIRGKLWGIVGASYPYLAAYALPALLLAGVAGIPALFWTLVCLPLTWLAMGMVGAAGLWCSVRSQSSWRALLGMLTFGYVVGFLLYFVTLPFIGISFMFIYLALLLLDSMHGTALAQGFAMTFDLFFIASCVGMVVVFIGMTGYFMGSAERYIATRERIRHWKNAPTPTRRPRILEARAVR